MSTPTVTLLLASPRGFGSTSNSLGSYLLGKLQLGGYQVRKVHVQAALRSQKAEAQMLMQVADCDLLILAFPLYIDCLPAPLIAALEKIAAQRRSQPSSKPQRLMAIVNNGFPESSQNATAIAICKQFGAEAGFEWVGGLSLGAGGAINGVPVEKLGFPFGNIRKALDLAAADLLAGKAVSTQAIELLGKPAIPRWLFVSVANRGWKSMAKHNGAEKNLYDKP